MPQQQVFQDAQQFLAGEEIPGWLIYAYRQSNPIFRQVITPSGHVTRPCFLYIPAATPPQLLVHYVDAGKFLDCGLELLVYSSREGMLAALGLLLSRVP